MMEAKVKGGNEDEEENVNSIKGSRNVRKKKDRREALRFGLEEIVKSW